MFKEQVFEAFERKVAEILIEIGNSSRLYKDRTIEDVLSQTFGTQQQDELLRLELENEIQEAIEHNGHKILITKDYEGKLDPNSIDEIMSVHADEHCLKPRLVFIANGTEYGTTYTKKDHTEDQNIRKKILGLTDAVQQRH